MKTRPLATWPKPDMNDASLPPQVTEGLRAAAGPEERGESPVSRSIALLHEAGLLQDDGNADPIRTARALMQVGAANLSVGRLWEGHVNALRLIRLYGSAALQRTVDARIAKGALLGVWGADGPVPVTLDAGGTRLEGSKRFASGLGTVTHALVSVNSDAGVRLALVDVRDPGRADASCWTMQGMRATASGSYDFSVLAMQDWVGGPDDYLKEPHFVGGVWRIAALQAGAAIGLLDRAATELRAMGRMQAEAQQARLMAVLTRAWAGAALAERAALASVDTSLEAEQIVATSIAARIFTEEVGLDAIRAVEQSIGLRHFEAGSDTGRMARDLAVYLRQAARDAFLQRAARQALGRKVGHGGFRMNAVCHPDRAVFEGREKLVVLAPHPDDESLACGALLARAFAGAGAHVICLTDGSASHPGSRTWPPERLGALRRAELARAIECLGGTAHDLTWMGLCDTALYRCDPQDIAARLEREIEQAGASHVFVPAREDHHEDHQDTAAFAAALRTRRPDWIFHSYPVWSRWDDPDFAKSIAPYAPTYLPPGTHLARKRNAIAAHRSQLGQVVADDPLGFVMPPGFAERFASEDEIFWRMP